jgi:hypothetical protein
VHTIQRLFVKSCITLNIKKQKVAAPTLIPNKELVGT